MAQSNFQAGDIVTLKSGGPNMTINEILTTEYIGFQASERKINVVITQWFNDKNEVVKAEFTEPQLKKVE